MTDVLDEVLILIARHRPRPRYVEDPLVAAVLAETSGYAARLRPYRVTRVPASVRAVERVNRAAT